MRMPPARATAALAIVAAAAWALLALTGWDDYAAVAGGFIPARMAGAIELAGAVPTLLTPLTATLLHGGLVHLAFNLVMLIWCGRYVEFAIGRSRLLLLYGVGAYAAAFAQYLADPLGRVPMIGASGAISAVLGAYALLYGRQRAVSNHPAIRLAAHVAWLAAAWIGLQLLVGIASAGSGFSIAIAAHIGGFLVGLALARPLFTGRFARQHREELL